MKHAMHCCKSGTNARLRLPGRIDTPVTPVTISAVPRGGVLQEGDQEIQRAALAKRCFPRQAAQDNNHRRLK